MSKSNNENNILTVPTAILVSGIIIAGAVFLNSGPKEKINPPIAGGNPSLEVEETANEEAVIPKEGVVLPVVWGDLGVKLASAGAIDAEKFRSLYESRGEWGDEYKKLLLEENNGKLKITPENASYILNLLWALGLAHKSPVLEKGEMMNPAYGGAGNFASTGGWTLAEGNAMDHYSRHKFFNLTLEQEALVDKVSRSIYRPCCNNSTHFPDCNHGMAMLGLLELMASQGVGEEEMYKVALAVNSYWFPGTYLTIAGYLKNQRVEWRNANPREILGAKYSSASGYKSVQEGNIPKPQGGGGCSV